MPNYVLINQLNNYILSVSEFWSWSKLLHLHAQGGTHKEYRGPDSELIFSLQVFEKSELNGEEYMHLAASVSDTNMTSKELGSSYSPVCIDFFWYKNQECALPSEYEIYRKIERHLHC